MNKILTTAGIATLAFALFVPSAAVAAEMEIPAPRSDAYASSDVTNVIDEAGVYDDLALELIGESITKARLGYFKGDLEGYTTGVLTVPSTGEESLENFSKRAVLAWDSTDKQKTMLKPAFDADNSVLVVITEDTKEAYIYAGDNLTSISDDEIAYILRNDVQPRLAQGNFTAATNAAVLKTFDAYTQDVKDSKKSTAWLIVIGVGILFMAGLAVGAIINENKKAKKRALEKEFKEKSRIL